jgi:hypothetical protein
MFCEVRLDCRAGQGVFPGRNVRRARRQHQRLPGMEAWRRPDRKRLTDSQMLALIRSIHAELKGAYGSPRMVRELRARGFSASKERVERLMRDNGIHASPQAALQGHDGLEARPAGGGEPAGQKLHADGAEPGLDVGHHLPVDR